ncbi:MAG: V-type ATPase subunit [Ruminococcus sp.]|nr:V-type ATPase subunit [Ruminococcus sp.]
MSTIKYANAVAAVKAMENTLLTRNDMEQFINATSKAEINSLISAKKGGESISSENVWEMIHEYAPDSKELEILLYKNDFHNLKAVLKSIISGRSPEQYYIRPTNLDLIHLFENISAKDYDSLPEFIRDTAGQAYRLIVDTSDGQLTDSFIDSATLKAMQKSASEFGSEFMKKYANLITVCCDIKTAYRLSKMKKQKNFLETAICGSSELDKDSLIRETLNGTESLMNFLESSSYGEAVRLLNESPAQFEKWCDDVIMELAETARMKSFGTEPLIAYYIASEAEEKNMRIIMVCREFGADKETITERMRKLYV